MDSNLGKLWDREETWESAELAWENRSKEAAKHTPLRSLKHLPNMLGIAPETAKGLKWKSLRYMIKEDADGAVRRGFLTHPLRYGKEFFKSALSSKQYVRNDDFFLYGLKSVEEFQEALQDPNSILIAGFSYCHKPHECPSGRFTPDCQADESHPVCQQCFIGKCVHALPEERVEPVFIMTIHHIGTEVFRVVHGNPGKRVLFLITACEMTLEMFSDWGNMVRLEGIGVRLDGRICNTMRAFELSEKGVKPGLTVVTDETQQRMLDLIRIRRNSSFCQRTQASG